jgi:ribosomal protein S19
MKRAKWKGPLIANKNLSSPDSKIPSLPRSLAITSQVVGTTCNVHTGKKLVKLNLTDEMIGHKLGEFASTREKFVFKKKKKKK